MGRLKQRQAAGQAQNPMAGQAAGQSPQPAGQAPVQNTMGGPAEPDAGAGSLVAGDQQRNKAPRGGPGAAIGSPQANVSAKGAAAGSALGGMAGGNEMQQPQAPRNRGLGMRRRRMAVG